MKSAIKDANGNPLRQNYRVESLQPGSVGRQGKVIGLRQPYSITVEWDDGTEDVIAARLVTHLSKLS